MMRLARPSAALLLFLADCDLLRPLQGTLQGSSQRLWWSSPTTAAAVSPVSAGGRVFFVGSDHRVHAVRETSGLPEWIGGFASSNGYPATGVSASGGLVFVPDFALYAFDQATGQLVWVFRDAATTGPGYFTPVLAGDGVLTGSESGYAYHLRSLDGTLRWRVYVGTDSSPTRVWEPAVSGAIAVFAFQRNTNTLTGGIVALDLASGSELWRQELTPVVPGMLAGPLGAPLIRDSLVVVAGEDGTVRAFDVGTGRSVWASPRSAGLGLLENELLQIDASASSVVVAASGGSLTSLTLNTGLVRWRITLDRGQALLAPLRVASGVIYTVLLDGTVVAVSEVDGSTLWRAPAVAGTGNWTVRPAVTDSAILLPGPTALRAYRK
ncbi:MAG: PQQ-binding-like beta-propeller repeat protein [Gemmatimonadetes bacterium]|nr:PQQ-binding-like beta-propeller repeat protein [Gemmatimonadota bacterium]